MLLIVPYRSEDQKQATLTDIIKYFLNDLEFFSDIHISGSSITFGQLEHTC